MRAKKTIDNQNEAGRGVHEEVGQGKEKIRKS